MCQRILAGIVIACLGALSESANAEILTFHYSGIVDGFTLDVAPLAQWLGYTPVIGDQVDVVISFDSSTADLDPDPMDGEYRVQTPVQFIIGGVAVPTSAEIFVVNNSYRATDEPLPYRDRYVVTGGISSFGPCPCDPDFPGPLEATFSMTHQTSEPSGPFSSDALPLTAPNPSDFGSAGIGMCIPAPGGLCEGFVAHNVTIAPTPAVGWLLAPAFGVLGWIRHRVRAH